MKKLKNVLWEMGVIIVPGVVIALLVAGAMRYMHRPTLADFKHEYAAGNAAQQEKIAEKYLSRFSAAELLGVIDGGNVDGVCHVQSHGIGRAVYERTQNFSEAIKQCGDACTFGCFHGAMMQMFATDSDTLGGTVEGDSPAQYLQRIKDVAPGLCLKPEVESVVRIRSCTHGIGHSFQSLTNDLDGSVRSCAVLKDQKTIDFCRAGVFMEYLSNASSSAVAFSKGAEPCNRFPDDTAACYQYKAYGWIRAWGSVSAALHACDAFGRNALMCIRTIGRAGATEEILRSNESLDALCSAAGDRKSECYIGAYQKAIDLDNADNSDHVCDRVDAAHVDYCQSALNIFHESTTYAR